MFTHSFKIQKHVTHVCEVKLLQSCLWHLVVWAAAPSSSAWPWGSACRQDVVLCCWRVLLLFLLRSGGVSHGSTEVRAWLCPAAASCPAVPGASLTAAVQGCALCSLYSEPLSAGVRCPWPGWFVQMCWWFLSCLFLIDSKESGAVSPTLFMARGHQAWPVQVLLCDWCCAWLQCWGREPQPCRSCAFSAESCRDLWLSSPGSCLCTAITAVIDCRAPPHPV